MHIGDLPFTTIWAVDFEFTAHPGEKPQPICMVAKELKTGQVMRLSGDELLSIRAPPYPTGDSSLVVAYFASAEMSCHLALGWPMPTRLLDLYTEYRCTTNGRDLVCAERGLLGALATFGLPAIEAAEKDSMRQLAIRGGPFTASEHAALLDYCESDVIAVERLLTVMLPHIDLPRAILRGRYMRAVAHMENAGIPIDVALFERIKLAWPTMKEKLVRRVDTEFGVYEGTSFRTELFEKYLRVHGIDWPRLGSGRLALDDDTFRDMARVYPELEPLRQLRHALSELRLNALEVGNGRNRTLLSPFGARSSRNTPSTTKFIFGPAVWLRGLIRPRPGYGLAYIDWCQQEFGIAAALSGDPAMLAAYTTGDPYLTFGKQAGRIPPDATKESHGAERELFKACTLGVQYGQEAQSLARKLGVPLIVAQDLLTLHRQTYPRFWAWADGAVDHALLHGWLHSVFGWHVHCGSNPNPRSFRNFLMQANGAEMLRLACCFATERGVMVCAPVHDALLIEAPLDRLEYDIDLTQGAMARASAHVLGGFELRSDVKRIHYPDRYADKRGEKMWNVVMDLIDEVDADPVRA